MLDFFIRDDTRRAVRAVSEARQLTVIVGAGVSMEVGLPSWEGLVRSLLQDAISNENWDEDKADLTANAVEGGMLAGAEIVTALLDDAELEGRIRHHLYGRDDPSDLYPGSLALSIARMQEAFGNRMTIATTNYDELLEGALRLRRWTQSQVHSYVRRQSPPAGHVGVTHLHGLLGSVSKGALILSEHDYNVLQSRTSWQERWMLRALDSSTCVFLGASLTDPNLLRYLHGHAQRRPHYVLFRRVLAADNEARRKRDRWETMLRARWNEVGVIPLFADNLSDIAQFVHEATARRLLGDRYVTFPTRLQRWFDRELRSGCLQRRAAPFARIQKEMNARLEKTLRSVLRGFETLRRPPRNETLALALWALYLPRSERAGQERVAIWASSDRVMTNAASIQPIPIAYDSPWTGVKAICDGAPREEEKDVYATRWRYVYAIPVYRQTRSYRLPLGAITLSTTAPEDKTVLRRLPPGVRPSLGRFLARRGRSLLGT